MTTASSPTLADPVAIAGFSRAMEIVLTATLVVIPVALGVYALGFSSELAHHPWVTGLNIAATPLSVPWSFAACAVLLVAALPLLYAMNAARLMFGGFRHGQVFTLETAERLKQIALGLLAETFMQPLGAVALSAVLSGAGKTQGLVVTLSLDQFWVALFALIFLGIARVMRAAALLAEDHAAIV